MIITLLIVFLIIQIVCENFSKLRKWSLLQYIFFPAQIASYDINTINIYNINYNKLVDQQILYLQKTRNIDSNKPNSLIFYLHGNMSDIGYCNDKIDGFISTMEHIDDTKNYYGVAIEYSGYGPNKTFYVDDTIVANQAVYLIKYLQEKYYIQSKNIIIIGRSIGTGFSCQIASKLDSDIKALILISPFTTTKNIVYDISKNIAFIKYFAYFIIYLLLAERFDNLSVIQKIKCPLLLIHSNNDVLINSKHTDILFENSLSYKKQKVIVDGDHNKISLKDISDSIKKFFI